VGVAGRGRRGSQNIISYNVQEYDENTVKVSAEDLFSKVMWLRGFSLSTICLWKTHSPQFA